MLEIDIKIQDSAYVRHSGVRGVTLSGQHVSSFTSASAS